VDEVTRDEFIRRLTGLAIVSQVNANPPLVRIAAPVEPAALLRWAASAAQPPERTTATQFARWRGARAGDHRDGQQAPDASGRVRSMRIRVNDFLSREKSPVIT
jgi:hypothetical protein